jgi:hypothetical protein
MKAILKAVHIVAALALLAPCAALANVTDDVKANGGTVIPALGLSIDVAGNSSFQNHTTFSHAVDMGFAYARSKRKQDRDPNDQPIIFGGTTFMDTAGDIQWTSNIQFAHIGYRPRWWIGNSNFAIEGLVGLGWAGLGIKGVAANGQSAAERMSNAGLVVGVGGIWRFLPTTALQVRAIGFGSGEDEGVSSAGRWDLTVVHSVSKNLLLRGGLGVVSAYSARENADDNVLKSPIRASGAGLFLGVDLAF